MQAITLSKNLSVTCGILNMDIGKMVQFLSDVSDCRTVVLLVFPANDHLPEVTSLVCGCSRQVSCTCSDCSQPTHDIAFLYGTDDSNHLSVYAHPWNLILMLTYHLQRCRPKISAFFWHFWCGKCFWETRPSCVHTRGYWSLVETHPCQTWHDHKPRGVCRCRGNILGR